MAVLVNILAIPGEENTALVQYMEDGPIAQVENTIDTKIDDMLLSSVTWTFLQCKVTDHLYRGYQITREYVLQADPPPQRTPMNIRCQN